MNVPCTLSERLVGEGHTYRHVRDIAMARANDATILDEARRNDEVIATHDLDYGHLLAFSGEPPPSVTIFRIPNTHPDNLYARILHAWTEIEKPLQEGAIVTIEDATLRIRQLPITRESGE